LTGYGTKAFESEKSGSLRSVCAFARIYEAGFLDAANAFKAKASVDQIIANFHKFFKSLKQSISPNLQLFGLKFANFSLAKFLHFFTKGLAAKFDFRFNQ
jgi:hypothetical protein